MLKEEKALRAWVDSSVDPMHILHVKKKITALIRAVREEDAKKCDAIADEGIYKSGFNQATVRQSTIALNCAFAIRGKR